MRSVWNPVLAPVLLVLLLPPGGAQLTPSVSLAVTPDTASLGPGGTADLRAVVAQNGNTDATGTVRAAGLPAGWRIVFANGADEARITVPANGQLEVPVQILAPSTGEAPDGTVTLTASLTDAVGRALPAASDTVALDFVPPAVVPAPPPPPDRTALYVGLVLASLLLVALVAYLVDSSLVSVRLENADRRITIGSSETYIAVVTNRSPRPRNVQLRVRNTPPGWFAAFAYPTILVQPKESVHVPLNVRAPTDAHSGDVGELRLSVRPGPLSVWLRHATLATSLVDPGHAGRAPS